MLKEKNGSILSFVLVVFALATTFGLVLGSLGLIQNKMANREVNSEQAYLSAKSMSDFLEENINTMFSDLENRDWVTLIREEENGLGVVKAKIEDQGNQLYRLSVEAEVDAFTQTIYTQFKRTKPIGGNIQVSNNVSFCDSSGLNYNQNVQNKDPKFTFECVRDKESSEDITINGGDFTVDKVDVYLYVRPNIGAAKTCEYSKNNNKVINIKNCIAKLSSSNNELELRAEKDQILDVFLNVEAIPGNKEPTENRIDGTESNGKAVITVHGSGTINIWLTPENYNSEYNYYTLPSIVKANETDKVVVNVYATEPNFNLVIYNSYQNKSDSNDKVNGTVFANIINTQGTVILASSKITDDNANKMGADLITGTIQCKNLVIDGKNREASEYPFNINTEDAASSAGSLISLGHVK